MKKIISFFVLCLMLSVVFTACKSNIFIKRHYNDGYYIAKADRTRNPGVNSSASDQVRKANRSAYAARQRSAHADHTELVQAEAKPNTAVASSKSDVIKPASSKKTGIAPLNKMKAYALKMPELKNPAKKKPAVDDGRDGLSLFWIVILAILILWAIAFIAGGFGLGDIIHVILVIALVLLILWLLRII
ncbi:MAG: hypothetical protein ACXVNR_00240 [Bacteroidia bacterium]